MSLRAVREADGSWVSCGLNLARCCRERSGPIARQQLPTGRDPPKLTKVIYGVMRNALLFTAGLVALVAFGSPARAAEPPCEGVPVVAIPCDQVVVPCEPPARPCSD
jgi:hypothetical protein